MTLTQRLVAPGWYRAALGIPLRFSHGMGIVTGDRALSGWDPVGDWDAIITAGALGGAPPAHTRDRDPTEVKKSPAGGRGEPAAQPRGVGRRPDRAVWGGPPPARGESSGWRHRAGEGRRPGQGDSVGRDGRWHHLHARHGYDGR